MWEQLDDNSYYNEVLKQVITWTVYGDKKKYFLSQEYEYENDPYEDDRETSVLINVELDDNLDELIQKTLEMRI